MSLHCCRCARDGCSLCLFSEALSSERFRDACEVHRYYGNTSRFIGVGRCSHASPLSQGTTLNDSGNCVLSTKLFTSLCTEARCKCEDRLAIRELSADLVKRRNVEEVSSDL
ncbi:hypothetical protein E2C01_038329 [Portunus trituberculatus]|uniref:Uncharacterized protein n=1 Tax=Portunus trituberculatus TaxID=210409 RepID=A0A5B7FBY2_PORTR|nr:hypothetical protein [Portunus trituberculatus]